MKSHCEEKEYLSINGKDFDVSNVPYNRVIIASEKWEAERLNKSTEASKRIKSFNDMVLYVILYLVRQPFKTLLKRYTFKDAIKEYFKRLLLTKKAVLNSTRTEYENIEDWIYFKITGKKKASLVRQKGLLDIMEEHLEIMEKATTLDTEQCLRLLQTFVQDQTKTYTQSTNIQKA